MPQARFQVSKSRGNDEILVDKNADKNGQLHLGGLKPGEYWLGCSSPGFNLHFWHLTVSRLGGRKNLRIELSLGT